MSNRSILRYSSMMLLLFSLFQLSACKTTTGGEVGAMGNPQASHSQPNRGAKHLGQIALLLPAAGNLAESSMAIREGFYAAAGAQPNIKVYDTNNANVQNVYRQALDEGADFVVGPLAKEEVRQLSMLSNNQLSVPVLALNTSPGARHASSQFFQFSLAPETEAEQIAEKARQQGYQTAGVIVPDNAWGKRIASAFSNEWQRSGGTVRSMVYSNPNQDQSAAVRRLLGVKDPQPGQKRQPKDPLQDRPQISLDFIMMAAHPDQARQLKPLFNFYFADHIPVLATSSVYSGSPNPTSDRDINGIIFCDMPWLLNPQRGREIQNLSAAHSSKQSNTYNRLFAMGVDAYHLTSQVNYLQSNPGAQYPGATGDLSVSRDNQIERRLAWAKIRGGVPVPL